MKHSDIDHSGLTGVGETDHGGLAGLADDDHPQYVKDSEYSAKGRILVGTGAGTFTALAVGTNDQVLTADSAQASGVKWADAGVGGGGGTGKTLPLDVPPGSAHANDDEFDDTTGMSGSGNGLNARWTSPQSSGSDLGVTISYLDDWMVFQPTTAGTSSTGKRAFGIRQAAPSGSFTVSCRVTDLGSDGGGDDARSGLFVARSSATAYTRVIGHQLSVPRLANVMGVASYTESADWAAYDGSNDQNVTTDALDVRAGLWYRAVWDSGAGTIAFYYSANGVGWKLLTTHSSLTQPDRIGLVMYANSADIRADHRLAVDWFRVTEP